MAAAHGRAGRIISAVRGEPTLLRKLQAAKKEAATAKSPAKSLKASSQLQGFSEEGGNQGEGVRMMKVLQSQKARIVAQMVPAQLRVPPARSTTESPFENAENVAPAQGERRVRVRTKEILGESHLHKLRVSAGADDDSRRIVRRRCYYTDVRYHAHAQGQRIRCGCRDALYGVRCVLARTTFS